ncbi:hypothetical protein PENNAL_c0085G09019 [Penicillium nalgiovense]|uniref:Uncharacterized protein n=1 Tax=Penicillium nalgiovense TaxID=60175 RepID=A0A1V6XFN5_PENNA|nr:hypothetical protein PENNAL_c0085G09019 [Penicillium nalgiovense]
MVKLIGQSGMMDLEMLWRNMTTSSKRNKLSGGDWTSHNFSDEGTLRSEASRKSYTPTSVIDASGRRLAALQALIRESKRLIHKPVKVEFLYEIVHLKLANDGSRPSDAVLLRQSTLLRKWNRSEKAVDFRVGNLIGHLPNHDPSKKVTALFWIDVCFFSKDPVAFRVKIDSAHRIEENSICRVESIAICTRSPKLQRSTQDPNPKTPYRNFSSSQDRLVPRPR